MWRWIAPERHAPTSRRLRPVEAYSKERNDPSKVFDLLLWIEDGWLAGVEIVDYVERHGDDSPDEIPPADYWTHPQPYEAA